jgi:hypothetical protein
LELQHTLQRAVAEVNLNVPRAVQICVANHPLAPEWGAAVLS